MRNVNVRSSDRKRLLLVALGLLIFFSLIIIQFFKIQILEGEKWSKQAKLQHRLAVVEPAKRGVFYSNVSIKKGHPVKRQPFVIDVPQYHLYIDPLAIEKNVKKEVEDKLLSFLLLDAKKLHRDIHRHSRSRRIALWLNHKKKKEIDTWWYPFARKHSIPSNAIYFLQDHHRSYPFGSSLGALLHTVRLDRSKGAGVWKPTGGLELYFQDELKGEPGRKILFRSPRHSIASGEIINEKKNGSDIYLTINHHLQAIVEEELEKAVKYADAKGGFAILMDPHTGEVLSLGQFPQFDPAKYAKFFNNKDLIESTKNKSVVDCYEIGSTMKPLSMVIAFLANEELKKRGRKPIFSKEEKVAVSNGYFPGRSTPIRDVGSYRFVNMDMAMQKSSNIYVAKIMQRVVDALGEVWFREQFEKVLGFGHKTGIEIPGETAGFLPKPGRIYPNGQLEWSKPTVYSLAFGYNLLASPIQLIRAYSMVANGGYEVHPTILKKIVRWNNEEVINSKIPIKNSKRKRLVPTSICNSVTSSLKFTTKKGGTGVRGEVYGYTEAGKSSTTEKIVKGAYSKEKHMASFIGYAPAFNPRFVLLVGIDEPKYRFLPGIGRTHYGGKCAAPVFERIMKRSLEYLGVKPDDPYGYPKGDPRHNPKLADYTKEVEELRQLFVKWNY